MTKLATALAMFALAGCSAATLETSGQADTKDDGAMVEKIRNGTRTPTVVPLEDNELLAIGWLFRADWGSADTRFCTGTVVAPRVVVTASHCTDGLRANQIGFGVGLEPAAPEAVFQVAEFFEHPSRDAAILILNQDVSDLVPQLMPIAANRTDPSSLVGQRVEAAGYGETYDASRTGRWFASLLLNRVDATFVHVDGQGQRGICFGDSGGPVLDHTLNGVPVVLGVESSGDADCLGQDQLTRLDAIADWIADVTGGIPAPGEVAAQPEEAVDPCGGLTYEGACDGDVAQWCGEEEVRTRDCATNGQTCGWAGDAMGYYCVDRPEPEPEPEPEPDCPGLGYEGACQGDLAVWCQGDVRREVDCSDSGRTCDWAGDNLGFYCVR
jgi:V8-like Glu-specific endopeptidase